MGKSFKDRRDKYKTNNSYLKKNKSSKHNKNQDSNSYPDKKKWNSEGFVE